MIFDLNRDPSHDHHLQQQGQAYTLQARGTLLAKHMCSDVLNATGFLFTRVCLELAGLLSGPGQEMTPETGSNIIMMDRK